VSDEHNYFVAGDVDSPAVLVHNTTTLWSCTRAAARLISADPSLEGPLRALDDLLRDTPQVADDLGAMVGLLEEIDPALGERLLVALAQPDQVRALQIAGNASTDAGLTAAIVKADLTDAVLGGRHFADVADKRDEIEVVLDAANGSNLDDVVQSTIVRDIFESPNAPQRVENAGLDPVVTRRVFESDAALDEFGSSTGITLAFLDQKRINEVIYGNQAGVLHAIGRLEDSIKAENVTAALLATADEAAAALELARLQNSALDVFTIRGFAGEPHGFTRHGAQTSLLEHYIRIGTGQLPAADGGLVDRVVANSSRSVSHVSHLAVVEAAIERNLTIELAGQSPLRNIYVRYADNRIIGEGLAERGSVAHETQWALVAFRDGVWNTSFFPASSSVPVNLTNDQLIVLP